MNYNVNGSAEFLGEVYDHVNGNANGGMTVPPSCRPAQALAKARPRGDCWCCRESLRIFKKDCDFLLALKRA